MAPPSSTSQDSCFTHAASHVGVDRHEDVLYQDFARTGCARLHLYASKSVGWSTPTGRDLSVICFDFVGCSKDLTPLRA